MPSKWMCVCVFASQHTKSCPHLAYHNDLLENDIGYCFMHGLYSIIFCLIWQFVTSYNWVHSKSFRLSFGYDMRSAVAIYRFVPDLLSVSLSLSLPLPLTRSLFRFVSNALYYEVRVRVSMRLNSFSESIWFRSGFCVRNTYCFCWRFMRSHLWFYLTCSNLRHNFCCCLLQPGTQLFISINCTFKGNSSNCIEWSAHPKSPQLLTIRSLSFIGTNFVTPSYENYKHSVLHSTLHCKNRMRIYGTIVWRKFLHQI